MATTGWLDDVVFGVPDAPGSKQDCPDTRYERQRRCSEISSVRSPAGDSHRKPAAHRILALERLEDRTLLTAVPTLTTLATSASTAVLGQTVTLTATVTAVPASAGTPSSGSVTFLDGTTTLGSPATLNSSGVATLQVSTLPPAATRLRPAMAAERLRCQSKRDCAEFGHHHRRRRWALDPR